jgi:hypothetical protein
MLENVSFYLSHVTKSNISVITREFNKYLSKWQYFLTNGSEYREIRVLMHKNYLFLAL